MLYQAFPLAISFRGVSPLHEICVVVLQRHGLVHLRIRKHVDLLFLESLSLFGDVIGVPALVQ